MKDAFKVTWQSFISAEPVILEKNLPCVALSFGGEEGPVVQYGISLEDSRELLVSVLSALASHGDELALEIGNTYFPGEE